MKIISASREIASLSWRIFSHAIGAKYRKSFLWYFWMVAPALLITAGVTLASRVGIITPGITVLPYPLFALFGTLLWQVFCEAVEVPHQAFEGARSYLTRVNFPPESIILAQLYESLITTAVRLILALLLLAVTNGIDLLAIALVSSCFAAAVLLGMGIGCMLMPFSILFVDLHNTIKLVLGYGLFLTPAIYQPQGDGLFSMLVRFNPVSPLMDSAREAAAGLVLSHPQPFVFVLCAGVLATVAGFFMVRAAAPIVIERMLLGGR